MRIVKCNCMTKTPEPRHHKETCPVFQEGFSAWWDKLMSLADNVSLEDMIPPKDQYPNDGFEDGNTPKEELDDVISACAADC